VIFVSQAVFDEMMQYYSEDNISYSDFLMLDYRQINTENASLYDGYMEQFKDADKLYNDNIRDTLERFFTQQKTIKHTRPIFFMNDIRFNFKFIYSHKIF